MNAHAFWLVVPAAGIGQRMQSDLPKQYLTLNDRYLVDVTLDRLLTCGGWAGCVVPLHRGDQWWRTASSSENPFIETCEGGDERADSVMAALAHLRGRARDDDWVLVHDVARPCVHNDDITRLRNQLADDPCGGLLAAPVSDTVKEVAPGTDQVLATRDRSRLWRAFTPQMFRFGALCEALQQGLEHHPGAITDEASAMERAGWQPRVVPGRADNIKITVPEDLVLAEFILARQVGS